LTIIFRTPTSADIPALATLGAETFMDTFGHLYPEADSSAYLAKTHSVDAVTKNMHMPDIAYQVAEENGALIGYCKIGALGLPVTPTGTAQELYQLYVRKEQAGTGVAHTLMRWALDTFRARRIDEVYLSVYQDNLRAQKFYQKFGFEQFAEYEFIVGEQADAEFIYKLALAS
jgi:diamine N-acetyltransferase